LVLPTTIAPAARRRSVTRPSPLAVCGAAVQRGRLLQGLLGAQRHHRVQLAVQPLDPLKRAPYQLHGGHLPPPHRPADPLKPHAASSSTIARARGDTRP
jgi:hypothetical protein